MNAIHQHKEKDHQPIGSRKKKILFILTGVFVLILGVTLVAIHLHHENIWASYEQAVTQKEKAQASMQELTKELDTLLVDEQACLSNVNESDICMTSIELSQKAHATAKRIERTDKIAHPKEWIYSSALLQKIHTATKQAQADEKDCILLNQELKKQIKNLKAMYLDKALTDYTSMYSTMQTTVDTLQALIDSTQGTVTDDTVRQDAQTAVTDTRTILDAKVDEKNLDELRAATSKLMEQQTVLGEKSAAITASHEAYQQAAAQQAASGSNHNGGTYNNRNNSNGSSGGGDYSQENPDDSPTTWDNESNRTDLDYQLPEGFRDI